MVDENLRIAVIGLGYVGLPLATAFGEKVETLGFDISDTRIKELCEGYDRTKEVSSEAIIASKKLHFSSDENDLSRCNVFIVTVPTPIDKTRAPDLQPLVAASKLIASKMSSGSIVIFESTVYPGATEEVCVPLIEDISGLILNEGFFVGYSPERINPGDKRHTLKKITKVVSGSNTMTGNRVKAIYDLIIDAGTYLAPNIKTAEAAKVIENTQRDLNIALVNELSKIFERLNIDTNEVIDAAATKWNFMPFRPGLVGGHCIGVDPYYLTFKAEQIGYHPEVILAGRRINDGFADYVASLVVKRIIRSEIKVSGAKVLLAGFAFKENCPDIRNTKVYDLYNELRLYNVNVDVWDPWVDASDVLCAYGVELIDEPLTDSYDALILSVPHDYFVSKGVSELKRFLKENSVFMDLKSVFTKSDSDVRL